MKKKRILIVVSGNYDGAIAKCSWNIYTAFKSAAEYEVKCVLLQAVQNGMSEYDEMETYNSQKHNILAKIFPLLSKIMWLRKIKRDFSPDYTISTLFSVNILNVFSKGKDKTIGIFHSPYVQAKAFGFLTYCGSLFSYNFIYPFLDKLVCVSKEVEHSLSKFPLIFSNKIEVVYNIHDIDEIKKKSKDSIEDKIEEEIFNNPTILYCGRMDINKAPERALISFAKAEKPKNAQIVFVGVDKVNCTKKLQEIAKKYSLTNRVHILGKKNNPYPYFQKATALISSSYSEGLPGVMIEALSLGTPVITTNSSRGIWEIFSAEDMYQPELDGLFENECGIISSNLSSSKKDLDSLDIANMAKAISKAWTWNKVCDFRFKENVDGSNIIKQLIK